MEKHCHLVAAKSRGPRKLEFSIIIIFRPPRKGVTTALFNSKTERFLDPKSTKYFNERIRSKDTRFADQMDRSRASQSARL